MKKILYLLCGLVFIFILTGFITFLSLVSQIPRLPDDLRLLASSPTTEIYGRNGDLISTSGGRDYVSLNRISSNFQKAVIAAEDKRFHKHRGVDHIATFRAFLQNIIRFGGAPGGSSITQQLSKNLFFSLDRSWKRKLLEAMAAMAIEDRFTKDEILEAYCNLVPFGQYSYGIERASRTYFGKHASELDVHEAALLAGLPNAPSRLNPFRHLDRAKGRQQIIIRRMAALNLVRPNDVDSLIALPIKLTDKTRRKGGGSYEVDYALELTRKAVGSDPVNYGGVRINTSIDTRLQNFAQRAITSGLDKLEEKLKPLKKGKESRLEGALVAIDVGTGQIVALVGGRDYAASPYNRAVKALRQPGSSFKPIVYLTALEKGEFNPATLVTDKPIVLQIDKKRTWKPHNFDNKYQGKMTLKLALMRSRNSVAAQLIEKVRPQRVVKNAYALGITTKLEPHLSLCLGAQGLTPLEITNVYATLARGGTALEPHLVRRIERPGGEIMYEHLTAGESRFAPETVYQLLDMMTGVLDGGTGSIVRRKGFKGIAIGKTGTSSGFRDSWFIGATPYLVTAVWVGYDDNHPMKLEKGSGVTGASGAAPIWADFMINATAYEPSREFPRPSRIRRYYIEPVKGVISQEPKSGYIPIAMLIRDAEKLLTKAKRDSVK
ncbi:MAG: transglycosylase domain-containing protein [Candidatus Hatepunaea meridiana]|nr:transglycosylase domain-containing protein [Candidatus Hatepunaea meridiana]